MDTETIDRLTAQYVWAIQSEGAWYELANRYVANRQFGNFRCHTSNFIHKIRTLQQEALSEEERAFVIVTLWEQAGGKPEDCLFDPGSMRKEITALLDKDRKLKSPYESLLKRPPKQDESAAPADLYITYGDAYTYRAGHKFEKSGLRYKPFEDERIRSLFLQGFSALEIADQLQRTPIAICERMVNHGLLHRGPDGDYYRKLKAPESAPHTSNPCGEIALHLQSAAGHLDRVANNLETIMKENQTMSLTTNPNVAIETKTVIFGQDAASMSEQQLIDAIKRVEGDIAKLKEVKTSSKKIASNIKELEAQLDAIVAVLDAR